MDGAQVLPGAQMRGIGAIQICGGFIGGEDIAALVAAYFGGLGRRRLLKSREIVGADLDGIDVGARGAPVDLACSERGEHYIDGHLYGVSIFKRRERDGVLTGTVRFDKIARTAVVDAEGLAAESQLMALAAAWKDVTALGRTDGHGITLTPLCEGS